MEVTLTCQSMSRFLPRTPRKVSAARLSTLCPVFHLKCRKTLNNFLFNTVLGYLGFCLEVYKVMSVLSFRDLKLWPHLSVMSSRKSLLEQASLDQAILPLVAIFSPYKYIKHIYLFIRHTQWWAKLKLLRYKVT